MQALQGKASPEPVADPAVGESSYFLNTLPTIDIQDVNILLSDDNDGVDALDTLHNIHPTKKLETPYLGLLDFKMPRMAGFEFLRSIRATRHRDFHINDLGY